MLTRVVPVLEQAAANTASRPRKVILQNAIRESIRPSQRVKVKRTEVLLL
jgi:hypothetical protein